ncbi:hypothetical protein DFH09DRAFT_1096491 [Mycena vulgaris]|nr:hypothetical protein DFH09DRAFT_1096491 [Mycena vulgaris]
MGKRLDEEVNTCGIGSSWAFSQQSNLPSATWKKTKHTIFATRSDRHGATFILAPDPYPFEPLITVIQTNDQKKTRYAIHITVNIGMRCERAFQAATRWTSPYTELATYEILRDWLTYLNCLEAIQAPIGPVLNPRVSSDDVQSRQYLACGHPALNKFGDQMLACGQKACCGQDPASSIGHSSHLNQVGISSPKLFDTRHSGPASSKCNIAGCLTSANNVKGTNPPPFRLSGGCGGVIVFDGVAGTADAPPYSTAPGWKNAPTTVQAQCELRWRHHVRRCPATKQTRGHSGLMGLQRYHHVQRLWRTELHSGVVRGCVVTIADRIASTYAQRRRRRRRRQRGQRRREEKDAPEAAQAQRTIQARRGCSGVTVNRRRPDENTHPWPLRLGGAAATLPSLDGARDECTPQLRFRFLGGRGGITVVDPIWSKMRARDRSASMGLQRPQRIRRHREEKSGPATVQAQQGGGITAFGDAGMSGNEPAAIQRSPDNPSGPTALHRDIAIESVKVVLGVPVRYRVDVIARQELDPRRNAEPSSRKKGKEE